MRYITSIICLITLLCCGVSLNAQHRQISRAEYFWDIDPGIGNALPLIAADGNFNNALEAVFQNSAALPTPGYHTLGIRVRAANSSWSPVFRQVIEILPTATTLPSTLLVSSGEFYWDLDPGEGNGTPLVAYNGNFDEALETVMANATLPSVGFHKLNIRLRDVASNWGPVYGAVVEVTNAPVALSGAFKVTAGELFWDNDPGPGNGTSLLALNGNFDEALETALVSAGVPNTAGPHNLSIRLRDTQNNWGPVFSSVVEVSPSTACNTMPSIKIAAAEYYFDVDPGAGNATPMLAFDGNFNVALEKIMGGSIPSPVAAGYHTLYMRIGDAANHWGPAFGVVVYMDTTINFTAQINGPASLCPSGLQGVQYSAKAIFGNTYSWSIVGGNIVSGLGTNSITVDWNTTGPHELSLLECNMNTQFCDSTSLVFSIKPNAGNTIARTICEGQNYLGYSLAGTYNDTFTAANGCDSIRTLVLTVNPIVKTTISITLCNGQQYQGYTASGTYIDTFSTATGCDSIRTLALTVLPHFSATVSRTLCYGDSYQGYNATGTYTDTFLHASGCDSVRVLYLTVLSEIKDTVTITLCQGNSYAGYSSSGVYIDTSSALNGCDSIRILYLTVLPNTSSAVSATVCYGDIFEGHNTTGVYTRHYTASNGCDSIRTITLTVRPPNATSIAQTLCFGQTYSVYGATGTFVDTFTATNGCDSIRTLHLTVLPLIHTVEFQNTCYGDSYFGYTQGGTYIDTFIAANGCDSFRTLHLTILPEIAYTSDIFACEGDVVDGYYQSGTYIDTFTAASGCDSIRTLVLTIVPKVITSNKVYICQGDSIKLGNSWYFGDGAYSDSTMNGSGCYDITITLVGVKIPVVPVISVNQNILSIEAVYVGYQWFFNGQPLTGETTSQIEIAIPGKYTVQVIDENLCSALSDEFELLETGIVPEPQDWTLQVYPNPVNALLSIKLLGSAEASVGLYNSLGEIVYSGLINHGQLITIDMAPYAAGIYYLKATSGDIVFNQKVTKTH